MKMHIKSPFLLPGLVAGLGSILRHLRLAIQREMFLNHLVLLIVLGASPAVANLVQDGSFEAPVGTRYYTTGRMGAWTVSVGAGANSVGIYKRDFFTGANVTNGNQAFDLGMGGYASGNSLSQVLSTVAGQTYRLSFDWGSEYANGTSAFVSVGDLNENLVDPARGDGNTWIVSSSSYLFIASGNDTLTFSEPAADPLDGWGLALDNISIEPVNPQLTIVLSAPNVILSWPTNATGFVLQSATTLANGGDWQDSLLSATETNGQQVVPLTLTGARGFFRLHQP